jgi:hypothetical protein
MPVAGSGAGVRLMKVRLPGIRPMAHVWSFEPLGWYSRQSLVVHSELTFPVSDTATGTIGLGPLRPAPSGLPDPAITPPSVAEAGDPFAAVRVIDLLARIERGRPVRIADLADRLNATWLDWLFPVETVIAVVVQLQANWMADYRNSSGVVLEDGPQGTTVTLEDSSRVDPWIVRQAQREAESCRRRLAEFGRRDHPTADG